GREDTVRVPQSLFNHGDSVDLPGWGGRGGDAHRGLFRLDHDLVTVRGDERDGVRSEVNNSHGVLSFLPVGPWGCSPGRRVWCRSPNLVIPSLASASGSVKRVVENFLPTLHRCPPERPGPQSMPTCDYRHVPRQLTPTEQAHQHTLLCGESTLPTPHHPLQRLPSHPLMPQPRRRLPTQLSQNSYRLTIPPHPRIRLRHIQAMPVPRVRRSQPRLQRQPTSHLQHPVRPIRNQLRLDTSQLHGERTERPPAPQLVVAVTPNPSRSHARQPERLSGHIRPVVA